MAEDLGRVTVPASSPMAQIVTDMINEAWARAVAEFEQVPPGEEATLAVMLTTETLVGTVGIGLWNFALDANGDVHAPGLEVIDD